MIQPTSLLTEAEIGSPGVGGGFMSKGNLEKANKTMKRPISSIHH